MSGLCDTCRRNPCRIRMDGLKMCDLYKGGETRWRKLFGTPEKVADFIIKNCRWDCYACPFEGDICGKDYSPNLKDGGEILEWLKGDAE